MKEFIHSLDLMENLAKLFTIRADINKVFDSVEWRFIKQALSALGVLNKLVNIIMACLISSRMIIMINS
jgi:hypothetical protein